TDKGAALLGTGPEPPPVDDRILVVQPNFDVVAMEFVPEVLDELGQFAVPVSYDRVASFRIERRQVNLALTGGWNSEGLLSFLRAHARRPIPQNVEQSLRDWGSAIRRARFVRALVVQAEDPTVLEELAAARALGEHVHGLTQGAVLLLDEEADIAAIARALRAEGVVLEGKGEEGD
ncbi:MAG: helicase-associated domain-containing protein, partial [Armatimonadota bacterium]|nr:helicase-associated domain-containing protein [Armatimonadota bacterium]